MDACEFLTQSEKILWLVKEIRGQICPQCAPEVTKLLNEFQSFMLRQVFLYRKECLKEFQLNCECTEPLEKERSQLWQRFLNDPLQNKNILEF